MAGPSSDDLEKLYAAELPFVYGFLHRLGNRGGDLEDLAHDVFVTAMRRWSSYDPARPVRPWLFGIAFRVTTDSKRRASTTREVSGASTEDVRDEQPGGEERVLENERRALINEALKSLEGERRTVFVMHELEGLSANDIAGVMQTPVATTYSRLRVAREEFAAAVQRIQLRRGER